MAGSKAEQYIFNWKVFTGLFNCQVVLFTFSGWDYSIGNTDTASNNFMAVIIKLRESIAECRVQTREKFQCFRFAIRVLANMAILSMFAFSIYCITFAVKSSQTIENKGSLLTKNQVPTVISTITHVFPMIFDLIGRLESYHPRTAHRAHLARVLVLYVLNYMTFVFSLFDKLDSIRGSTTIIENDSPLTMISRGRRQIVSNNGNRTVFISRNFTSASQLKRTLETRTPRQTFHWPWTTRPPTTTQPPNRTSAVTVDGEEFEVQSQFGPVGVNNAKALIRNGTTSPGDQRYETRKIGPTPLPEFQTPLPPDIVDLPTFKNQVITPET